MTTAPDSSAGALTANQLRLERLVGREVLAANNRAIGRLEEIRAERRGSACVITEYVIGAGGLLERLGIGLELLFSARRGGHVARWDQIDITDPDRPRLLCPFSELREL